MLEAKIGGDTKPFAAAIAEAKSLASGFQASVDKAFGPSAFRGAVASALSVGFLTNEFDKLINKADQIYDSSNALGITAEQFQAMDFAAKQSGTSIEAVGKAIQKITLARRDALDGDEGAVKKFAALGISIEDVRNSDATGLFYKIGERVKGAAFSSDALAASISLMGKSGKSILGAMRDGFVDVAKSAKGLGIIIENDVVKRLSDTKDEFEKLKAELDALKAKAVVGGVKATGDIGAKVMNDSLTGFLARIAGAMSAGQSINDALVTAFLVDNQATYKTQSKKPKKKGGPVTIDSSKQPPSAPQSILGSLNVQPGLLTENQRVGAFSRMDPLANRTVSLLMQQVKLLEQQLATTKKIEQKTPSASVDVLDYPD